MLIPQNLQYFAYLDVTWMVESIVGVVIIPGPIHHTYGTIASNNDSSVQPYIRFRTCIFVFFDHFKFKVQQIYTA